MLGGNHADGDAYVSGRDQTINKIEHQVVVAPLPERHAIGIRTHAEEVAGLSGLRRHLTGDYLSFVEPGFDDETHPARILSRLAAPDGKNNILLVGVAGIGKTRTCFEVGARASEADWTVLHVSPGEPLVTTEQLAVAVEAAGDRVLVIIDYLNESAGLDLVSIRQRVLPAARSRGQHVALLASARPGWQIMAGAALNHLFATVRLADQPLHSASIQDQIIDSLAPRAQAILGPSRLRELCGLRPIIAMLIALEAEAQAAAGTLDPALPGIRPEELIGWLSRRMGEDRLIPQPTASLFADNEPALALQALTGMLAASPQEKPSVIGCGRAVLGGDEQAEHLLGILRTMGWVVQVPDGLAAVHDIVTDQFLERVLLRPASWTVRTVVAERVLGASLTRARSLGRYATNLTRMIRDLDLDSRGTALSACCTNWLALHAECAGQVLSKHPDEGAYAIAAVIESPFWSPVAFTSWHAVVTPWLSQFSHTIYARHLLYKGLRAVQAPDAVDLVPEAMRWLEIHGAAHEASFVLARLLERTDLGQSALTVITHAVAWLDDHRTTAEAGFVLAPLLKRTDLGDSAPLVIARAVAWLDDHKSADGADFVFRPLLERTDLGQSALTVITHAVAWLDDHRTTAEAGFVLARLLKRTDLGDSAPLVIARAVAWLTHHGAERQAGFVVRPLLARDDLPSTAKVAAKRHAQGWLAVHGCSAEAGFVFPPLIARMLDEEFTPCFLLGIEQWMEANPADFGIGFIAKCLYQRSAMTERLAALILQSVQATADAAESVWLLSPVVRSIFRFPQLAENVLSALEDMVRRLPVDHGQINSQSEFDSLVESFTRCPLYSLGIPAARLDDVVITWLDHPRSLSGECPEQFSFAGLVTRVLGIAYSGRFAPGYRDALLARIRAWMPRWRCASNDRHRTRALASLSQAEATFGGRERSTRHEPYGGCGGNEKLGGIACLSGPSLFPTVLPLA